MRVAPNNMVGEAGSTPQPYPDKQKGQGGHETCFVNH